MTRKRTNLALDNTLRYIYNALRYRQGRLVAIEFKHNGRIWRADTVQEALALRAQLEEEDMETVGTGGQLPDEEVWTPDLVTELLENAGSLQKKFLRILDANLGDVKSEEIVEALNIESAVAFAGVLSGLSKQLKSIGLKPSQLYSVTVTWCGKTKTRRFRLNHNFKFVATEIGWPDKWE